MKSAVIWGIVVIIAIAAIGALSALHKNPRALFAKEANPGSPMAVDPPSKSQVASLATLIRKYPWAVPVDFSAELFQQGNVKGVDAPQGLKDYKTLPMLLDYWSVNPISVPKGSTWAGVKLDETVKPLDKLDPAEQRMLMLRYRSHFWGPNDLLYTATSPLRYIPIMAMSGKSELTSLEDILTAEYSFGRGTIGDRLSDLKKQKSSLSADDFAKYMREEIGILYTSWVTGQCFEPWHAEFSRGNGIFREVTDPKEREKLRAAAMEGLKGKSNEHDYEFLNTKPDSATYYVAKLYGEKEVIWQSVIWTFKSLEEYHAPLSGETESVLPLIIDKLKQNKATPDKISGLSASILEPPPSPSSPGYGDYSAKEIAEIKARYLKSVATLQHGEFAGAIKELESPDTPLGDKLVPYEALSDTEKQALGGQLDQVLITNALHQLADADMSAIGGWEDTARAVLSGLFPGSDTPLTEQVNGPLAAYSFDAWLSPITGKTTELWHKEWSRGNGYVLRIDDPAANQLMRDLYLMAAKEKAANGGYSQMDKEYVDKLRFYYVRLYGDLTGSIISEGVWSIEKMR